MDRARGRSRDSSWHGADASQYSCEREPEQRAVSQVRSFCHDRSLVRTGLYRARHAEHVLT
jgi:hypothetical protein